MPKTLRRLAIAGAAVLAVLLPAPAAHADDDIQLWLAVFRLEEDADNGVHDCIPDVLIYADDLKMYVSAEQNTADYPGSDYGALRARTPSGQIGPWERFQLCSWPDGYYTLQASNYYFVTADYSRTDNKRGMLRAGYATTIGLWEEFDILCSPSTHIDCYLWNRGAYTNNLVSAEEGVDYPGKWRGLLRARANGIGPWEVFG